jgi:hypothetical protein
MNGVDFLLSVGCCRRCALIHCGVRNYAYFGSSSCVDAKLDEIRGSNRQFGALDFEAPKSFTSNIETNQDEPQITSLNLKPSDRERIAHDDMEEGMSQNQTICVSCIGLLQEFGCSMEVIAKVSVIVIVVLDNDCNAIILVESVDSDAFKLFLIGINI